MPGNRYTHDKTWKSKNISIPTESWLTQNDFLALTKTQTYKYKRAILRYPSCFYSQNGHTPPSVPSPPFLLPIFRLSRTCAPRWSGFTPALTDAWLLTGGLHGDSLEAWAGMDPGGTPPVSSVSLPNRALFLKRPGHHVLLFLKNHSSSFSFSTSSLKLSAWLERSSKMWSCLTVLGRFPLTARCELSLQLGLFPHGLLCASCLLPIFIHSAALTRKALSIHPQKSYQSLQSPDQLPLFSTKLCPLSTPKKVLLSPNCIYSLSNIWYLFCIVS